MGQHFVLEALCKIAPIQRKLLRAVILDATVDEKEIEDDIDELVGFFADSRAFAGSDYGFFMDVVADCLSRIITHHDKRAYSEILLILSDIARHLADEIDFEEKFSSEEKEKIDKSLEDAREGRVSPLKVEKEPPKTITESNRTDGYIPKPCVEGGPGVPLFDKSQILAVINSVSIYRPVIDYLLQTLKKEFRVEDIVTALRIWYADKRALEVTTLNAYGWNYLKYFTREKLAERWDDGSYHLLDKPSDVPLKKEEKQDAEEKRIITVVDTPSPKVLEKKKVEAKDKKADLTEAIYKLAIDKKWCTAPFQKKGISIATIEKFFPEHTFDEIKYALHGLISKGFAKQVGVTTVVFKT